MNQPVEDDPPEKEAGDHAQAGRCPTCRVELSSYNPGPYCWRHAIGHPWRGPSAKPKY